MLVRLLFASRAVDASAPALEALCASARQHNAAQGVTGVLVYGDGIFMQALEGGRQTISDLYGLIQRDPRHQDVVLLHYEEITERRFGGWTMGLVNTNRINPATLLKYNTRAELDPYSVSGRASLALLEELMATASIAAHA
ncbi:BLUF domain-containing protein [Comamonadaceae bacterium OH2545_COT-014]|nr:BLUF domain-containing protein [Comamonadaceae bacterium OH2545_COT-014]